MIHAAHEMQGAIAALTEFLTQNAAPLTAAGLSVPKIMDALAAQSAILAARCAAANHFETGGRGGAKASLRKQ